MYRIVDSETGNGSDVLRVNYSSGDVIAVKTFDRESADLFIVRVLAEDGGRPPRTAYTTVNVHIADTDDHQPKFSQQTYDVYFTLYC